MLKREQNIAKVQARFDKKIHKAQSAGKDEKSVSLMQKKDAVTKNFDQATKYIQAGFKKYNDIIKNYRDVKLSQLSNISNKITEEKVQRIIKAYKKQRRSDRFNASSGGMAGTKMRYALEQFPKKK